MPDEFTFLRQKGYFGTLAEMRDAKARDTTARDSIGEALDMATDQAEAQGIIGVGVAIPGAINIPGGLSGVTGTPSGTTFLRGDSTWAAPPSALPVNNPTATGTLTVPTLTVSTAVNLPANSVQESDIANLVTDLANLVAKVASTGDVTVSPCFMLKTTNPSAVRPTMPAGTMCLWNLPGSTPPANMGTDDLWIGS